MSQHSNGNPKQKERAKNLRRLRMQISQTKWLISKAHLSSNKIVFKTQDGQEVELTAALISKTQRNIYQVRKFKKLASQLIKDVDSWLSESVSLLEKYKILNEVSHEKIKNELKKNTKERDKREIARLLPYLEVEANCINVNEYPLCRALLTSPQSSFALENFLFEYNHSDEAKALAALILGVLNRHERKNISHLIKKKTASGLAQAVLQLGHEQPVSRDAGGINFLT